MSLERSRRPQTPRCPGAGRACRDGCVDCAFPVCYTHASRQYTTTSQPGQSSTVTAFRSSSLTGPCWTAEGRAKLSPQQHRRVVDVQRMSCELYNALLDSWRNQRQRHQRKHQHDNVHISDIYDDGRIAGDRGTLYQQFSEHRRTETSNTAGSDVLWGDLAVQTGRGVIDRFDKAATSFYQRCVAKKQGSNIKAGFPRYKPWRRWTTIVIPAPAPGMVQPPVDGGKWWKLKIKGLGVVKFVPFNAGKLSEELAAGGRIQEIRIVTSPLRTEIHVVVRTVTPDPVPSDAPVNPVGADPGIKHRVVTSNGYKAAGVAVDRTEITKHQRALSRHDHNHRKNKTRRHTPGRARKVKALGKAHARVRVSERHRLHRLVHEFIAVCDADGIAVEKLNIANMVKNRCSADRIYQQRWGMFLRLLDCESRNQACPS